VAHLPSGIVLTSWTFLPWPIAGAANTSATPSAPTTDPLSLTEPPSEKWLPSGGGRYSPRAHSALSPSPPRVLLVRCAPQPANGCAYGTRGGSLFARLPVGDYVSGTLVGWEFDAPAGTEIVGYRISRSTTVGAPSAAGAAPAY